MPLNPEPDGAACTFHESECELSLAARFEKMVACYGSRIAVKTSRSALTYKALNEEANLIANAVFEKCGAGPKPVSLLFEPGASEIAAILGVLKSGNFYVPLNTSHPTARTMQILQDAQPALLLTDPRHEERALTLVQSVLNVEKLDGTPGDNKNSNHKNMEQAGDAPAYILYTSGSTGEPKGVLHTQRNVLFDTRQQRIDLQTTIDDRYALLFASSSSASVYNIFGALLNGAAILPFDLREQGFERLTKWLVAEEITILEITVVAFRQWCAGLDKHKPKVGELFPQLRVIAPGGEPVYKRDFELYQRHFAPDCVMQNGLGATETRTIAQYLLNKQTIVSESLVPVGDVAAGKEVLLWDENRQPVAAGETGEIAVRSRYLSPGYWRRPELTEAAFLPDPEGGEQRIYLTGDLGRYDADGRLVHLGRKDFQVKIRGNRIEIAEVEMAISRLTGFSVAVAAFADETENKQLVAYLAVGRRSSYSIRELRDQLRKQLPEYAVPTRFEFLDTLPLTFNGKLNRLALPAPKPIRATRDEEFAPPNGRVESAIARLFEEILVVDPVGATDDFFALGGHSLLAAQLTLRIEEEFGQFLSPSAIVQAPTVRELSLVLQQEATPRRQTLVQIRRSIQKSSGAPLRPPLFCLPGAGGNALQFHRFAAYLENEQSVYGFDLLGMDGREAPHTTIEAMSEHYLAEIKAVQPKMPYLLCGYSMGGLVAFEIARRLLAAGDEVALLALFDTDYRDAKKRSPQKNWRTRIALRTRFKSCSRKLQYYWYMKRGQAASRQIVAEYVEEVQHLAAKRYVPREYSGVITYFRAKGQTGRTSQPLADGGWGCITSERVEAYDIVGTHRLVQEPYVGELAQQMRFCIEKALKQE